MKPVRTLTAPVKANPTVSASPNPAPSGSTVSVSGSGYNFQPVLIEIAHPDGHLEDYTAGMWAGGFFGGAFSVAEAGSYRISVYYFDYVVGGFKKTSGVLASTTLLVT